jgi:uncharacterized FlgJ-related protein
LKCSYWSGLEWANQGSARARDCDRPFKSIDQHAQYEGSRESVESYIGHLNKHTPWKAENLDMFSNRNLYTAP